MWPVRALPSSIGNASRFKIRLRNTIYDLNKIGPTRLFRNRKTDQRFLAAEEPNGDVIYAELDENDNPIYARNRLPKDEYDEMLDDLEIEADHNTVGFTFFSGEFIKIERPERL
jgi:hypothetical protein